MRLNGYLLLSGLLLVLLLVSSCAGTKTTVGSWFYTEKTFGDRRNDGNGSKVTRPDIKDFR